MSTHPHLSLIQTITRNLGITVTPNPSVEHPIPVPLFFRNNPDGTLGWLWPKGGRMPHFPGFPNLTDWNDKRKYGLQKLLFSLGLDKLIAHGRMVVYADLPTATYLQHWRRR
ncbi:MAG: hypothetical protein JNK79_07760 [Chitinophagaceae bacterium]|nr:hypothetical protein [Chitinophagaceae bacterium]